MEDADAVSSRLTAQAAVYGNDATTRDDARLKLLPYARTQADWGELSLLLHALYEQQDLRPAVLKAFIEACPFSDERNCALQTCIRMARKDPALWDFIEHIVRSEAAVDTGILVQYQRHHPLETQRQYAHERLEAMRQVDKEKTDHAFQKRVPAFFLAKKYISTD
jgi:hypothetical protein